MSQVSMYPASQPMLLEELPAVSQALSSLDGTWAPSGFTSGACEVTEVRHPTSDKQDAGNAYSVLPGFAVHLVYGWGQHFDVYARQLRERFKRLSDHLNGETNTVWRFRVGQYVPEASVAEIAAYFDLMPAFDVQAAAKRHAERLSAYTAAHPDQIDIDIPINFDGADW